MRPGHRARQTRGRTPPGLRRWADGSRCRLTSLPPRTQREGIVRGSRVSGRRAGADDGAGRAMVTPCGAVSRRARPEEERPCHPRLDTAALRMPPCRSAVRRHARLRLTSGAGRCLRPGPGATAGSAPAEPGDPAAQRFSLAGLSTLVLEGLPMSTWFHFPPTRIPRPVRPGQASPALLLALLSAVPGPVGAAPAAACFAETGYCVQGRFYAYWLANGGLAITATRSATRSSRCWRTAVPTRCSTSSGTDSRSTRRSPRPTTCCSARSGGASSRRPRRSARCPIR